jgi:flagellar L-ring protein precursor FlgH
MDRRKKAHGKWALTDWITLDNFMLRPDKQGGGDPMIAGEVDTKYQAEAELETRDSMKFRIACHVVDIRPNGSIVLEGHRNIRNNFEVWEMSLSGTVRPEDIMPDNTVESENIAELRIDKREAGHVRDGYRRGWLQLLLDQYQPF